MYQNRPIYTVAGKTSDLTTYRAQVFEYTSFIQTPAIFEIAQVAQDSSSRTLDFYQYNVTTQQFHLFTVMPGYITDDIGATASIDYTQLRVSIVDLTDDYQDEVMRWQLQGCGDGIYNSSTFSFEQCDRSAQPPRDTYKYPSASNWLRKDVWYDVNTRDYYTCSDICLSQPVDHCGDGYESNGPYDQWDSAVYTSKDTREYCDDGNKIDGDGCSSTCVVEPEWECMDDPGNDLWGLGSCRPKCGNGIHEDSYPAAGGGLFTRSATLAMLLTQMLAKFMRTPAVPRARSVAQILASTTISGSVRQLVLTETASPRATSSAATNTLTLMSMSLATD